MTKYKNLSGGSGIYAYTISDDSIIVQFNTGATYIYNYSIPGISYVEHMKKLALTGIGLNTFISTRVRKSYASRLR